MPIDVTCSSCGSSYKLKDEFAGKKARCKECQSIILIPEIMDSYSVLADDDVPVESKSWGGRAVASPFQRDRFLLKQKRISISEKYYVFDDQKNPIMFVERPAHFLKHLLALFGAIGVFLAVFGVVIIVVLQLDNAGNKPMSMVTLGVGLLIAIVATVAAAVAFSPKRHIHIYTDDSKTHLLLEVLQENKFNVIRANYTVIDPTEGSLGRFQKNYLYNLFRKRWYGLRPDDSVFMLAQEDSLLLSLLRRLLGSIEILGMFLRTNFIFHLPGSTEVLGEFNRKFTLFDQYVLDLTADRQRVIDRRMAVALGVLLDTGERR
jgi:hypothetical protein